MGYEIDSGVTYNNEGWRILAVGAFDPFKGTCLHLASLARGRMQRNGWMPSQVVVWSDADGVVEHQRTAP